MTARFGLLWGSPLLSFVLMVGPAAAAGASPSKAVAQLQDASGKPVGSARFTEHGDAIAVDIRVRGLTPGIHGAHVHMTGRCVAPGFASAGGHWNPMARHHGLKNPGGWHSGDLPNLVVKANGRGNLHFAIAGARLIGGEGALLDADGAALVIHAGQDDMISDPAGNAGGRVACGVIEAR